MFRLTNTGKRINNTFGLSDCLSVGLSVTWGGRGGGGGG